MDKKSKIGILKYIASSGAKGVKFEDQPETWYNPSTDEAKDQVKEEYKGKKVEIMLVQGKKTEFSSMVCLNQASEIPSVKKAKEPEEEIEVEEIEDTVKPKTEESKEEEPDPELLEEDEAKSQIHMNPAYDPRVIENQLITGDGPIKGMLKAAAAAISEQEYTKETFKEMEGTKVETAKKGPMKLTYASWSEVWGALKRIHPTATYHVHEDEKTGMPYINDEKLGAFVKVSVKVKGITHTVHLPVMNNSNKAAKGTELDVFLINKNIMRCLVKAIAFHGLGLYVFKGEDLKDLE